MLQTMLLPEFFFVLDLLSTSAWLRNFLIYKSKIKFSKQYIE